MTRRSTARAATWRLHPSPIGPLTLVVAAEAHRGNLPAARAAATEVIRRDPAYVVGKGRGGRGSSAPAYLQGVEHVDAGLRLAGLPDARPAVAAAPAATGGR